VQASSHRPQGAFRHLRRCRDGVGHLLTEPDERPLHRGDQGVITVVFSVTEISLMPSDASSPLAAISSHRPCKTTDCPEPSNREMLTAAR